MLQELRATNDNHALGCHVHSWHARDHNEVDPVLYGERGLVAIEVKRSGRFDRRGSQGPSAASGHAKRHDVRPENQK
jgi:hypothetical protein